MALRVLHLVGTLLGLLVSAPALAYESDQLTVSAEDLDDVASIADARATELLELAIARTNERTGCELSPERTREVLARQVHQVMGGRAYVPARGALPPQGFGAYAAWVETAELDRFTPLAREDLYGEVRLGQSWVLALAGPSSTVNLGGILVGTDKIDHFWVQGFDYWQRSRKGEHLDRAVEWGTRTELGWWGLWTSGVFSYADLAANYAGFEFYAGLLEAGSPVRLDEAGCVVLDRPFRWLDHIDEHVDESKNPSVYRRVLAEPLLLGIEERAPELCEEGPPEPLVDAPWVGPRLPQDHRTVTLSEVCLGGEPRPRADRVVERRARRGGLSLGRRGARAGETST